MFTKRWLITKDISERHLSIIYCTLRLVYFFIYSVLLNLDLRAITAKYRDMLLTLDIVEYSSITCDKKLISI